MNNKPELVKETLMNLLQDMSEHPWLYCNNPGHDFTRQESGKLTFIDTMRLIISMGKETISDELINYFRMDADLIPTQSAFIQRRNQINLSAFQYLFSEFTSAFPNTTFKYKDHCILAADGSHVVYVTNDEILEDYNKPRMADYKGYNHMHLNAFVDVLSKTIQDFIIQPGQAPDEREALHTMLDHFEPDDPDKFIITADRGYESYDLIFHCILKKLNFVFRVKDPFVVKSILSSFKPELPVELDEYDYTIKRFFTSDYNNIMKEQKNVYRYMNPSKNIPHFKPLLGPSNLVYITFRVIKLKMPDGSCEYIITNLPYSFDIEDIRYIYHCRWNAETTFRYLKHAGGMLYFHSRKPEFLKQEIYGSIIMYNFGIFLANEAANELQKKQESAKEFPQEQKDTENKYRYTIDYSTAIRSARKYFLDQRDDMPVDMIRLLCKFIHAVKEKFRKFNRPLRGIGAVHFSYR